MKEKLNLISVLVLATIIVSVYFVIQPTGPTPHPTMTDFLETLHERDQDRAVLHFLTPHNRKVYQQLYLSEDQQDPSDLLTSADFENKWPEDWEIDEDRPEPRWWFEATKRELNHIITGYRINWRHLYLKECKERYRSTHTLQCEYTTRVWYRPNDIRQGNYRISLNYEYGADRIISLWVHPQD